MEPAMPFDKRLDYFSLSCLCPCLLFNWLRTLENQEIVSSENAYQNIDKN